jgi:rhodanese-related sulfurtransferase
MRTIRTTFASSLNAVAVSEISIHELAARLESGAVLIDVRQPEEYTAGHVPGARLVPLAEVPAHVDELPTDRPVLLICRSGARSLTAAEFLARHQIDAVNVAGGTLAWVESGRDVVTGPGAT